MKKIISKDGTAIAFDKTGGSPCSRIGEVLRRLKPR